MNLCELFCFEKDSKTVITRVDYRSHKQKFGENRKKYLGRGQKYWLKKL